jgi:hypothetical protein
MYFLFISRKKRKYRLLVNTKFSNHLSQCAYSVRKNNNAKLNNKKIKCEPLHNGVFLFSFR